MKNNINFTGKIVALVSFVIGTCLLSFYLYFGNSFIDIFTAASIIFIEVIVNIVILTTIIGQTLLNKTDKTDALKTCGLMLLNIPIAILYFYMMITFPTHKVLL